MEKNKKTTIVILILMLITVVSICVTIWGIFFRSPDIILTPDYAPQQTEENQVPIEGDSGDKMDVAEGGGAVSLTYSNKVKIDISDETAELMFANPGKSTQDMLVQIVVQNQILVQSGTLTPGYQVQILNLLDDAAKKLVPGVYEGKFVIYYYDTVTREKAIVNTEIPIDISVVE